MIMSAASVRRPSSRSKSHESSASSKIYGPLRQDSQHLLDPDGRLNASDGAALVRSAAGTTQPATAFNQRSEAEWCQALADTEERFRDLHHRIKNSLQLLCSL